MRKEVGFVSSRRAEESIAANLAVRENIYLNPAATGKGVIEYIDRGGERTNAQAALKRFSIKAETTEQAVATLSGGNQQKVVVARWMEARVKLLILEEPTIGVDIGSKAEIYHLLKLSLAKGMVVLLISSDFEEVERICHRALVFSRGRVVAEIPQNELTIERLTASAAGGASAAHVIALEPRGKGLMGTLLRYPYEVRDEEEAFDEIPDEHIPKDMLDLAVHIVKSKAGHFKPEKFEDRYENALRELIARKQKGEKIEPPPEPEPTNVINLMDALRRSIGRRSDSASGRSEGAAKPSAKKPKRPAAKKAAPKKTPAKRKSRRAA